MINTDKIEQKLGFDKIRNKISARCATSYGVSRAENEKVSLRRDTIEKRLVLTDEMRVISIFESSFPSNGFIDTIHFLKPLQATATVITLEDMQKLKVFINNLRELTDFFGGDKGDKYPNLKELAFPIAYFPAIYKRIDEILDRHGEVKDSASPELAQIRRDLREKEGSVSRRVQSVLRRAKEEGIVDSEASISVRDGKILIPVDAGAKRRLPGYIYDESATGKTVYIEPAEVVELNNEVRELYFAQQREILKILRDFSDFIRPSLPDLIIGAEFTGELDFIYSKARLALEMEAGKPIISNENELKLIKARHPLLEAALKKEGKAIIPLSLTLTSAKHILIISGPNAGGKSVCLKTTGLLQYMFQWGMLIPASETSELKIFKDIFIDIGDEQSLENDLSTYSSHLTNMKDILLKANKDSLVLIDEFGTGTEPTAGGAIAEAILNEIDAKGVFGVITTHYTNLKYFAQGNVGAINGAMLFDVGKIEPLYKLEIGLPGNSFAFELARKIGLPSAIIKSAQEKAGTGFVDLEKQLRKISRNKRAIDEKLQRIKNTDKTLEGVTERYQRELEEIQKTKKAIIEQAKAEAQKLVTEANKKIEATIKEIKEAQAEKERTKLLRKELNDFNNNLKESSLDKSDKKIEDQMKKLLERKKRREERKNRIENKAESKINGKIDSNLVKEDVSGRKIDKEFEVGDKVRIKSNGMVGEISVVGNNWISVIVGSINSKISKKGIEQISNNEFVSKLKSAGKVTFKTSDVLGASISERKLNFKPSIDIRGQRLDEALVSATKFIDDALMIGSSEVKILHGKGNGILKEEIRKFLMTVPGVASCKDEDIRYGGSGITVVTLE